MNKIIKEFDWREELINEQAKKLEEWGLEWNDDDWKEFILKALNQQKKEIEKVIEGKRQDSYGDYYWDGYNKALEDILKEL